MPRIAPFERHHRQYDEWFERHETAYLSELLALRPFVPHQGRGIEIGVGTGRFAAPLGVHVGVDPSPTMLARAAARGVEVVEGTAESLPFRDECFDYALIVTTICFVDSPVKMLTEVHRVLALPGRLVIGFIDPDSALGRSYQARKAESVFYREATFYRTCEVQKLLEGTGFEIEGWGQTLFDPPPASSQIEPLRWGYGEGGFVVVACRKSLKKNA